MNLSFLVGEIASCKGREPMNYLQAHLCEHDFLSLLFMSTYIGMALS